MKIYFLTLTLPVYIPAATGQTREKYIQAKRHIWTLIIGSYL